MSSTEKELNISNEQKNILRRIKMSQINTLLWATSCCLAYLNGQPAWMVITFAGITSAWNINAIIEREKYENMMKQYNMHNSDKSISKTNQKSDVKEKILANKERKRTADNHLAKLRNKMAKKIDNVLGTNLEEKKLATPLKKAEKKISDKLFGKVRD